MKVEKSRWKLLASLGIAASLLLASQQASGQADFYKGKTITIVQGRSPGDTGDMRVRAVIPFLQKYIPGSPTIVSRFIPGGGGRKAANYLYNSAHPDGLTIANIGGGFVNNAVLGLPGVMYDVDKVIYLGSANSRTSYVFLTGRQAGLDTLEKLRAASGLRVGGRSVGELTYIIGRLFAWIIPLKDPRFVTGYSGPELDLAVVRSELDARAIATDTVVDRTPEWIEKGLMHFHSIFEVPIGYRHDHPVYNPLPSLENLTRTDAQRRVLAMNRYFMMVGAPYVLPPGVPKERVDILKEAFRKTFGDPGFLKEFENFTGAPATPLMPEDQAQAVREIPRDLETVALFNKIASTDPLPPR